MQRILSIRSLPAGLSLILLSGCGEKNPVQEVSATSSGVVVVDVDKRSADLTWPSWRGPDGNGAAPVQTLPLSWSENDGVVWRADVPGRGHGSPIITGNSVLLMTAVAEEQEQQLAAFNRTSGERLWVTTVHRGMFPRPRDVHQKSTNANGTPATNGRHVYTAFLNNERVIVSAIDLDGSIVWQQEAGRFLSRFGYAPSPVLYRSLVIVAADNSGGSYLTALDGTSGQIAWRVARTDADSYSSPALATVGGRQQLLISGGDAVTSYDPESGRQLWSTSCIAEATCGTIVTTADYIFASGGYPDRETVCLSADGQLIWSNRTKIYEPSMIINDDRLFGVTDRGIAHCWEAATGKELWKQRLSGSFSASPLACGDRIYVSNLSGETFVFRDRNGHYEELAKNRLGNDCYASPAAANGKLFLRIGVGSGGERREQLVCLGVSGDN